jgi:hypothetical protein
MYLNGYGRFGRPGNKHGYAHRVAWEFEHGPIPGGLQVNHRCDVRNCVRPDHLYVGTQFENVVDMIERSRGHWQHKH